MKDQPLLINRYKTYDEDSLVDSILLTAAEVEDAYVQAGGEPNKDYTFQDVMNATIQLVVAKQKNDALEQGLDNIRTALYEIDTNVMMLRAK